jgi:hypothetical protein
MFIATSGAFSGEYVAQCAKGDCGYVGQPPVCILIEARTHVLTHQCSSNAYTQSMACRSRDILYEVNIFLTLSSDMELMDVEDPSEGCPPPVLHHSEIELENQRRRLSM